MSNGSRKAPAVNGRSLGADANRTVCGRQRLETCRSRRGLLAMAGTSCFAEEFLHTLPELALLLQKEINGSVAFGADVFREAVDV